MRLSTNNDAEDMKALRLSDDGGEGFQSPETVEIDAVTDARASLRGPHQTGLFQNAQMLGDGRLRQGQLVDSLAAYARLLAR